MAVARRGDAAEVDLDVRVPPVELFRREFALRGACKQGESAALRGMSAG